MLQIAPSHPALSAASKKKASITFDSYTNLGSEFHFPRKALFYKSWTRRGAEQTASSCVVIHGLIAMLRACLCMCLRCAGTAAILDVHQGCNSHGNVAGHALKRLSEKLLVRSPLPGRWSLRVGPAGEPVPRSAGRLRAPVPLYETPTP